MTLAHDREAAAPLVIIADDLTGASDAAVAFAKRGARAAVWIDRPDAFDDLDVAAVDLDTRAVSPQVAAERVRALVEGLSPGVTIVKKMDSTLRGNIAAEVEALLRARPGKTAIVVPAYPEHGRTQRGGVLYVHGTPVHETDYGRDLLTPVRSSRVIDYLPRDASVVVGSATDIERALGDGARAIAVDVERNQDLAAIAQLASDERFLFVGSAGLLESLAPALIRDDADAAYAAKPGVREPILLVIGSLSDATRRQIARYADSGGATEMVDPRTVLIDEGRGRAQIVGDRIVAALAAGEDLLVALSSERSDVEAAYSLGRAHGYDAATTSMELRERFVALVQRAVPLAGAIVLSGADVARSFFLKAGVRGMRLLCEATPGIPLSRGVGRELLLLPKGGGFGSDEAYLDIVASVRTGI